MYKLVLIRHGQSVYNKEKIFCGWTDVDLTAQGIEEAHKAGQELKKAGFVFDMAYSSVLKRCSDTIKIIMAEIDQTNLPVEYTWRLNERHYGALQGLKHQDMIAKYGAEQVQQWRRSYKTRPPQLEDIDPRFPGNDPKYQGLQKDELTHGESLEDTLNRVIPYWLGEIVPNIQKGQRIIVSACGNSTRALMKYIDNISDDDIVNLEIRTGVPIIYEIDENTLKPIKHSYLY